MRGAVGHFERRGRQRRTQDQIVTLKQALKVVTGFCDEGHRLVVVHCRKCSSVLHAFSDDIGQKIRARIKQVAVSDKGFEIEVVTERKPHFFGVDLEGVGDFTENGHGFLVGLRHLQIGFVGFDDEFSGPELLNKGQGVPVGLHRLHRGAFLSVGEEFSCFLPVAFQV